MALPKVKIASLVLLAVALCAGTLLWRGQSTFACDPGIAVKPSQGEDRVTGRSVVDQALQAHGGAATLAKFPAVTATLAGKFYGFGEGSAFKGEYAAQGSDRRKFVMELEVAGQKLNVTDVLCGNRGWSKIGEAMEELDADELAEAQEEAHAEWVATLVPLTDSAFQLTLVGETMLDQRTVREVKVVHQGRRDVHLFFDKQTRLLVKTQTRVKDDDGEEVTEETFLADYQEVQGTKQAMQFTIKRGGELIMEGKLTSCKLAAKLDDTVFVKP